MSMIFNLKQLFSSIILLSFSSLVFKIMWIMWRLQLICFQILFSEAKHLKFQIKIHSNFFSCWLFLIHRNSEEKIKWHKKS